MIMAGSIYTTLTYSRASLVAQMVKVFGCNVGDPGLIPGSGRSPEKKMATHSSTLPGKFHGWTLRACLEVLAGERSYSYTLDRRPVLLYRGWSSSSTERAASGGTHMER